MRIAFISSQVTHPSTPDRGHDGLKHDRTVTMLKNALVPVGGHLAELSWDDPTADWSDYDIALIGTPWDYTEKREAFLETLEKIQSQVRLENDAQTVAWNSRKTYLRALSEHEVEAVATVWLENPTEAAVQSAFDLIGDDELIFKPQVGASARNQHRLKRTDLPRSFDEPMMAQPVVTSVETEGEYSFVYVERSLSHCVLKKPTQGDYRVQEEYGGTNSLVTPSTDDQQAAEQVMAALEKPPLYARVDMVRNPATGRLILMELELVEPYLFPELAPDLGPHLVEAMKQRLRA